jgi:phosphate transport system permease protein
MVNTAATGTALVDLRGSASKRRKELVARYAFKSAALVTFLITLLIVITLAREAWDFFHAVDKSALWDIGWFPRRGMFDVRTLVVGTFIVTGVAMLVAVPLGLGAAVYLSEYAPLRVRRVVKPILEIIASVPSVVLGYFAISFINPELTVRLFSSADRAFNLFSAGIAVGVLSVPLIASVAEDSLQAVPNSLREASYGLGANRMSTTLRVVFPAAISGIVAALILGISRAVGETMVVSIAAGATGGGLFSTDPLQPGQTMTAAMAALGFGSDQVRGDDLAFPSLYFIGFLLFVMTFLLNLIGDLFVRRVREVY